MGSINDFLFTKILFLHTKVWVFVLTLFDFIKHSVFRFRTKGKVNPKFQELNTEGFHANPNYQELNTEGFHANPQYQELNTEGFEETQEPKSYLSFRFQRYEEVYNKDVEPVNVQLTHITASNNDGSEKRALGNENESMDEPEFSKPGDNPDSGGNSSRHSEKLDDEAESLSVDFHSHVDGDDVDSNVVDGDRKATDHLEERVFEDDSIVVEGDVEATEHLEGRAFEDNQEFEKSRAVTSVDDSVKKFKFDVHDDFMVSSDSDSESLISSSKFSFVSSSVLDSISDGFLSGSDFDEAFDRETPKKSDDDKEERIKLDMLSSGYEDEESDEEDESLLQELKDLEKSNLETGFEVSAESTRRKSSRYKDEESDGTESEDGSDGKSNSVIGKSVVDSEDLSNGMETQWEHQDLIEQLRMEIKKVRATGLPTILEESECPKITDDLKPWKIDDKYQHQGTMDEVHKFYKSYRDRMRKLDILNYQKMYAIGFLKLKDPLESFASHRHPIRAIAAIVSQDCWPCKPPKHSEPNPMAQFTKELERDLEMVYVGQLCLSWEFLHWEYDKALDLWDSDPRGLCRYNEVAGEFQKFQVLLQRFLEDEPFQGPRVPNYAKRRCVLRHLLQVPVIREDNLRNWKGRTKGGGEDAITSVMLMEIIEESIRIFWQFIRSDKDARIAFPNCLNRSNTQLENPPDSNLFLEIRRDLQKKHKKLKEVLRNDRCILRKFQKHHYHGEENLDRVLCFFSQVDMKLVSRVVNMSRLTTDQLAWCSSKLSNIRFVGRRINVEPSFLLFPCT